MKRLLSSAAAVAAFVGCASAQDLGNASGTIPDFDADSIMPVFEELGGQAEILTLPGGLRTIGVIMPDGTKFLATPTVCDGSGGGCKGLRALFQASGQSAETVNAFNRRGTVPKAVHEGTGVVLYHYLIGDHGFIRGNFEVNIRVMQGATQRYLSYLQGESPMQQSVSMTGSTGHSGTTPSAPGEHPVFIGALTSPTASYVNR